MKRAQPPLVSFVLAAHDAAATIGAAVESVLRQTVTDLELVVVDDGSRDDTPEILAGVADPRLVVLRIDAQCGLAASLNRGLDAARGRYVARLDADDVALAVRLERQLALIRSSHAPAVLGSAVLELHDGGRLGTLHEPPVGDAAVRWHVLFGSPFFHPTVLLDREVLDRHGLRYDPGFGESEDYDLWTRLLAVTNGDNTSEVLVLRRVHAGQASRRRRGLQRELQLEVAQREMARVAPGLGPEAAQLAWLLARGEPVAGRRDEAASALVELLHAFERRHGSTAAPRQAVARALARGGLVGRALRLRPTLPAEIVATRARRRSARRVVVHVAERWLRDLGRDEPVRVAVVSPEPTPYRAPLFDRIALRPEVDLTVVYAARTVAGRTWTVEPRHRAVVLRGVRLPGLRRAFRHDYPVTPGVFRVLREARPDVVVAHGWSTFPSQAAIAWSRRRGIPYLLLVSSHDAVTRPWWRRAVRRPVVPPIVRGAWGALALGTLSRASLVAHGVPAERVYLFANTIDVEAVSSSAERLAARRPELRASFGLADGDVCVLSAGRLAPEKGLDTLLRAVARADDSRLAVVVAGEGAARSALEALARDLGVRLRLAGDLPWERLLEAYVAADVFALLSTWEPWGVVVNEAAACGKPLVLSDQVGAAPDLLVDGENGSLVPAGDVDRAAAALRRYALDPAARRAAGARSREIVAGWGYEPSVSSFVEAVRAAAGRRPRR